MLRTLFTAGIEIRVVFLIERVGALMESGGIEVFVKIVIDRTGFSLGKDFFLESQNLVIHITEDSSRTFVNHPPLISWSCNTGQG